MKESQNKVSSVTSNMKFKNITLTDDRSAKFGPKEMEQFNIRKKCNSLISERKKVKRGKKYHSRYEYEI